MAIVYLHSAQPKVTLQVKGCSILGSLSFVATVSKCVFEPSFFQFRAHYRLRYLSRNAKHFVGAHLQV